MDWEGVGGSCNALLPVALAIAIGCSGAPGSNGHSPQPKPPKQSTRFCFPNTVGTAKTVCAKVPASLTGQFTNFGKALVRLNYGFSRLGSAKVRAAFTWKQQLVYKNAHLQLRYLGLLIQLRARSGKLTGRDLTFYRTRAHAVAVKYDSLTRKWRGLFGISNPNTILKYRRNTFPSGKPPPTWCSRPNIIASIARWIRRTHRACASTTIKQQAWRNELLEINCTLRKDPHGCEDRYVGWVWVQHATNSHKDHTVLGYARVQQYCPNGKVRIADPQSRKAGTKRNNALDRFLDACRPPPTNAEPSILIVPLPYILNKRPRN